MVSPISLVLILYSEWENDTINSSQPIYFVILLVSGDLITHLASNNVFYAIYSVCSYFYPHGSAFS